jgi:hypothetical protein
MAIQSFDNLIQSISSGKTWRSDWQKSTGASAYTAGRSYSWFTGTGIPSAGSYTGTALNAQVLSQTSAGALQHGGNATPDIKHLINMMALSAVATAVPGVLYLVDLLLYYPGISMNSSTAQTLVNTNTLPRYTTGAGVRAFLEISTASGATAHNLSMTYTDDAGNTGNAFPGTVACTASAVATHLTHSGTATNNTGPFLPLAAGDNGVRSVQSVQLSAASGAGTAALVLCKPLATIPILATGVATERNTVMDLPSAPVIQDGACLGFVFMPGAATVANTLVLGANEFAWG